MFAETAAIVEAVVAVKAAVIAAAAVTSEISLVVDTVVTVASVVVVIDAVVAVASVVVVIDAVVAVASVVVVVDAVVAVPLVVVVVDAVVAVALVVVVVEAAVIAESGTATGFQPAAETSVDRETGVDTETAAGFQPAAETAAGFQPAAEPGSYARTGLHAQISTTANTGAGAIAEEARYRRAKPIASEAELVGDRLLQSRHRVLTAKSQARDRTGGHRLKLRRAHVGQTGVGKCRSRICDERLGTALVVEKVKDEFEQGVHLPCLSFLSFSWRARRRSHPVV